MPNKTTTLPADLVGEESMVQDDQYIEFYENNPNMILFDPPLTLNEFKAILETSLREDGKTRKSTGRFPRN